MIINSKVLTVRYLVAVVAVAVVVVIVVEGFTYQVYPQVDSPIGLDLKLAKRALEDPLRAP